MVVIDTNIIIELFKNNPSIKKTIQNIGINDLAISAITVGEFYFGAINKSEMKLIENHLQFYHILPLTNEITELFVELMHRYSLSHKPFIGDMLIAASALNKNLDLYTLNEKDFNFIPEIRLYKPWYVSDSLGFALFSK